MANTRTATASRAPVIADKVAAAIKPAAPYVIKGKLAALRNTALQGIASLAYVEGKSRADTIAQLRVVLGARPTDADMVAAKVEYVTGRLAQMMPAGELPKPDMSIAERIAFARAVITQYAAPAKDGVKSNLKAGQIGRRSVALHKMVRANDEIWSRLKAELGFGNAQTIAQKNAKAGKGAKMSGANAKPEAPKHSELVKPEPAVDVVAAMNHLLSQSATLLAYVNKNAKVVPTDAGTAIRAMHKEIARVAGLVATVNA